MAAAILNSLYERPGTDDAPASEVTPLGLGKFVVKLRGRAGVASVSRKTAARRLLDYLTEPAKGRPYDGRINPDHLARLVVVLRRICRVGWDDARQDMSILGGSELTDAAARARAKRKQAIESQRQAQTGPTIIDG